MITVDGIKYSYSDFNQKYMHTILKDNNNKFVKPLEILTAKDSILIEYSENTIYKEYVDNISFKEYHIPKGYYLYNDSTAVFIYRKTEKQWTRGLCSSTYVAYNVLEHYYYELERLSFIFNLNTEIRTITRDNFIILENHYLLFNEQIRYNMINIGTYTINEEDNYKVVNLNPLFKEDILDALNRTKLI